MGKTKSIKVNDDGTCTFFFKDDVCTDTDGTINPGANQTGAVVEGMGKASLSLSKFFFSIFSAAGIPNHYISADVNAGTMVCKALKMLQIEFIWRAKAWGSFCSMYGIERGLPLNGLVEATLKSDALGDPRINRDACVAIGKITENQYDDCVRYTRQAADILTKELARFGYELIDFKLEYGLDPMGKVVLADEISFGIMRCIDKDSKSVDPLEAAGKICA